MCVHNSSPSTNSSSWARPLRCSRSSSSSRSSASVGGWKVMNARTHTHTIGFQSNDCRHLTLLIDRETKHCTPLPLRAGFSVSDVQNARNMENNALFLQEKKVVCCAALRCVWGGGYSSGDVSRLYGRQRWIVDLRLDLHKNIHTMPPARAWHAPHNPFIQHQHAIPTTTTNKKITGDPLPALAGGAQRLDQPPRPRPVARARAHPRCGFWAAWL